MNLDFEKLAIEIEAATRKSFQEIVANHAAENIYAFALYSDEGAMTVCPATNTMDFLVTRPQDDLTYYTFEPAEWCYEGSRPGDGFSAISHQLYEAIEAIEEDQEDEYDDDNDEEFEEFQQTLYQTCFEVLLKLKKENFFRNLVGKDIFLMFSVTDYEFDRNKLREMIILLNYNPYQQEYLDWMKTWRK
ncbi:MULTISPECIES: DUF4303 domain-containing protein [Elizabethkingia]|uniref:DUF4303 domain-containing protein n=1 Tax=Elizabethkingia TaxID=308865 RepID=UPI000CE99C61|nr:MULTISPECIES: DUF4303 domain-containing protein [Elizabethkingia]AVF49094.1 hypothetical protein AL491_13865 [Elizabethkingia anophelis]AVF53090.1 hypothetical protein AL492_16275 [Elizabethkingia anophelis]MBG0506774.1 DUF4303 domain-containing protein [Elizabethkingia anophelis]MCT3668453.1 DUF4303 domain-containing protein [Elizabethkingia anophelis]MCT3686810.1 DUF4303 domain-containing protein [Elizabethkingia anophelis]